jgi:hypothetical protein
MGRAIELAAAFSPAKGGATLLPSDRVDSFTEDPICTGGPLIETAEPRKLAA